MGGTPVRVEWCGALTPRRPDVWRGTRSSPWLDGRQDRMRRPAPHDLVHSARILAHVAPFTSYNLPRTSCHQQALAKNPGGYCGLGGTGASRPQQRRTSAGLGERHDGLKLKTSGSRPGQREAQKGCPKSVPHGSAAAAA